MIAPAPVVKRALELHRVAEHRRNRNAEFDGYPLVIVGQGDYQTVYPDPFAPATGPENGAERTDHDEADKTR
jgi:hypothetical protein